jgi:hypothetical protein
MPIREAGSLDPEGLPVPQLAMGDGDCEHYSYPVEPRESSFWFLMQLCFPYAFSAKLGGRPYPLGVYLLDAFDGSWLQVDGDLGDLEVREGGPRRLLRGFEEARELWLSESRPGRDRFGLTVEHDGRQRIWLDDPVSRRAWEVPG